MAITNIQLLKGETIEILVDKVAVALTADKAPSGSPYIVQGPHGPLFFQEVADGTGHALDQYTIIEAESPELLAEKMEAWESIDDFYYAFGNSFSYPGPHGPKYYQAAVQGTIASGTGGEVGPQGPAGSAGPAGTDSFSALEAKYTLNTAITAATAISADGVAAFVGITTGSSQMTKLLLSYYDKNTIDQTNWLPTRTNGVDIRIVDVNNPSMWGEFRATAQSIIEGGVDVYEITISQQTSGPDNLWTNGAELSISPVLFVAEKKTVNVWNKNNSVPFQALSSVSGTVATDASQSNNFYIELTESTAQLTNPTNLTDGMILNWIIKQGTGGSKLLTFGNKFKFLGGTSTVSTAAGAYDMLSAIYVPGADILICNLATGAV